MRCRTQQAKVEGGQYVIKRVGLNKKIKKTYKQQRKLNSEIRISAKIDRKCPLLLIRLHKK